MNIICTSNDNFRITKHVYQFHFQIHYLPQSLDKSSIFSNVIGTLELKSTCY
jgi:hypothetical protein